MVRDNDDTLEDKQTDIADEGVLTELFGNHSKIKILVALLSEDWHDLPVSKIADLAGLHKTTVYDEIESLVELNVVVKERSVAGADFYRINRESEIAKLVKQTEEAILDQVAVNSAE